MLNDFLKNHKLPFLIKYSFSYFIIWSIYLKFLYVRKLSEICFMSNICELIQIKPNNWIKVQFQGSVLAGFDASLDTAPGSLSAPILQLQICRWSSSHPPGATSSQPWPSWESPFSNLISTDYLPLLHRSWGFRLLTLQGPRGDPSALTPYLWCCTQRADPLPQFLYLAAEFPHQQYSVT